MNWRPTRTFHTYTKLCNSSSAPFNNLGGILSQLGKISGQLPQLARKWRESSFGDAIRNEVFNVRDDQISSSHYKRPTQPTGVPFSKLLSNSFPLSVAESVRDYKDRHQVLRFQDELLSTLPFYPEMDATGRVAKVLLVPVYGISAPRATDYINEFCIYPPGKTEADFADLNHLVVVHGYGAGLGFFLKNFEGLSSGFEAGLKPWVVHAIDLLGYGCSSRPEFHYPKVEDQSQQLEITESWFHDSFEQWRVQRGLTNPENILCCSHSLGAYLSATYCMAYPKRFKKLMMVSPAGIIKHRTPKPVPAWFDYLWNKNISPFVLVRKTGPLGSLFVSGWTYRRFSKLASLFEKQKLHKYTYGIFNAKGSGEYILNYVLAAGANPRFPLLERLSQKMAERRDVINCDYTWVYGKDDWMDVHGGELCSKLINEQTGHQSTVVEVPDCGHHIYLDNVEAFNKLVVDEMKKF
ncbi:hypothetical protein BABINDRAFT_160032 [Babjeviella inositovora NRRL Y-12698]|uniref:AB hydrolase-1 domain-containing protein n=1 Tax=Babjeviella inositovora NRRL Y-12698 TaxID=984486 RepID=A0A1E3QXJ6_9ASCO|nr:uncharacterized protein BABINDRAFT_160032 [Babjeviella inositovora NRRL Y-12698]ODQ81792.1 hypothetical protein BABINDRAFT_160032 [Babjeviella inositovora NRRL Y-12698]